jgi:hypothetical protein
LIIGSIDVEVGESFIHHIFVEEGIVMKCGRVFDVGGEAFLQLSKGVGEPVVQNDLVESLEELFRDVVGLVGFPFGQHGLQVGHLQDINVLKLLRNLQDDDVDGLSKVTAVKLRIFLNQPNIVDDLMSEIPPEKFFP